MAGLLIKRSWLCIEKEWILSGSLAGLMKFSQYLKTYSQNKKNQNISEHDHIGPYWYLKIMTWDKPEIEKDSINGSLSDIARLSDIIKSNLEKSKTNDVIKISDEYTTNSKYKITLNVKEPEFDPASIDPMDWAERIKD
jgi:hypothetical protein